MLVSGVHRKEISGGFRLTTNNRMELMAVIAALERIKHRCHVIVYSDSQYVVNGIAKGWARRWRVNGWMRNKTEKAINVDLWQLLLDACERHDVEFRWVRGHAGVAENERCDQLSVAASARPDLPADEGFEREQTGSVSRNGQERTQGARGASRARPAAGSRSPT